MKVNLKNEHTIRRIALKELWLRDNRGILSHVAKHLDPPVSKQFVGAVYRGKRRSQRVEAALAAVRAPGFSRPVSKIPPEVQA
jgi:hypothetical protein